MNIGVGVVAALCLPIAITGCGHGGEWSIGGRDRANIAGPTTIVDYKAETIDAGQIAFVLNGNSTAKLDEALHDFNENIPATGNLEAQRPKMLKRDAAQDLIILASQSRCGYYEVYLKRFQSDTATTFGILATTLGGAGAIVTGADGARALSGLAGISSGVGAEVQKDVFANLASAVIVPGIEKRRYDILTQIMNNRCYDASRYTAGMAIADAIAYHAACSMDTGVTEAGVAVKEASTPGTAGLSAMIAMAQKSREAQGEYATIAVSTKTAAAAGAGVQDTQSVVSIPLTAARPNSGTPITDCTKVNPSLWTKSQ